MKDWPSQHDEHLTRMGCSGYIVVGLVIFAHVGGLGLMIWDWLR